MISKQRFFVAVAVAIGVAAGTALAARPEVVALNLTPSSAQLAACMPNARVDVTVQLTTDRRGFDVFHVHADGLPPKPTFTVFLLHRACATRQFENPDNAAAHRLTTAREIIEEIPGARVDAVVSGVGTGGTIVGLHEGMREHGCQAVPFVARPVSRTRGGISETGCFIE